MKTPPRFLGWEDVVSLVVLFAIPLLSLGLLPKVTVLDVDRGEESFDDRTLPIEVGAGDPLTVRLSLERKGFHDGWLKVIGDDCVSALRINDENVELPTCMDQARDKGATIDAGKFLSADENIVEIDATDLYGGDQKVDLVFSHKQGLLRIIGLFVIVAMSFVILLAVRRFTPDPWVLLIVFLGLAVRVGYNELTPYLDRTHDLSGHLDYIRYVAEHWILPPGSGYEYHQAPLYYFLVAPAVMLAKQGGLSETQGIMTVYQYGLIFSLLTVLAIVWLGKILFENEKHQWQLRSFLLLALLLPRSVMFAGAISNDALILPVMVVSFGFLMRYWKNGSKRDWYWGIAWFCVAFVTKLSAVILAPAFLVSFCAREWGTEKFWKHFATTAIAVALFAGWLPAARMLQSSDDLNNVVHFGMGSGGSEGLLVGRDPVRFTTFNPIGVLQHPYNNPWEDKERRVYFWEYFFRSSLYGEFGFDRFRPFAQAFLVVTMALCCYASAGSGSAAGRRYGEIFPLWATLWTTFAVAVGFAFVYPYASQQDFRFVPLIGPLCAYFVAHSIETRSGYARMFGRVLALAFSSLALIFIAVL